MNSINLRLDGDDAWPDLDQIRDRVIHLADTTIGLAVLPGGMESGLPSIALRIDLPDGIRATVGGVDVDQRALIFETSWAIFAGAARAIGGRYGWPGGPPS